MSDYKDGDIKIRVLDYLEEFTLAIFNSLTEGEKKHGNLWLNLPKEGQEKRIELSFMEKFHEHQHFDEPIDWASIAGNAMIGWIRENHPELWIDPD